MLELKNVNYKTGAKKILNNINLKIGPGEIVGLFGENGAGKTTLMKSILGFVNNDGEILLDGEKITHKNIAKISFGTSEHSFFGELNAYQHLEFLRDMFPKFNEKRFRGLMEFFDLPASRALTNLSLGQQNQFETIMALSQGADYIMLDEPFTANDMLNREDFYKMILGILEPNETVIMSTHLIDEVSGIVDRVILLKDGAVLEDIASEQIEEEGCSLTEYVKKSYNYKQDRVAKALKKITGED